MANLENSLNHANSKYINFNEHRPEYTAHYDALRKEIYSQWKGHETLGKLVNGYTLGGSYGDNLKVAMPDEFDLVIHLQFPENDKILVTADPRKPGNVILDMSKVMQILVNQEQNRTVFQLLQKIVNNKQQLLEDKLQSQLQGLMSQVLTKMGNQIEVNGVVSPLKYKRCGPAHTIEVKGRYEYSVDFVPAIKLAPAQNVLAPEQRQHFGQTAYWDAIPKPMKPPQPGNASFRASYYEAEKQLLYGKNNLKNAIRLLKQHRNTKSNMSNLKSYYIKTIFLWEVTRQDISYWQKPVSELLIEMLSKLADVLNLSSAKGKGKLPFFWDPRLDMIADLNSNQRADLFNSVIGAQCTFRRGDGNLTEDIKNRVQNSFSNGDKGKGLENKPVNGQGSKTDTKSAPVKEKTPPVVKPNPKPNEQKKNGEAQTGAKPKVKVEVTPAKEKTPPVVKPTPNPSAQKKNGGAPAEGKAKVKAEPVQVKPNPKPNEQKGGKVQTATTAQPNPNQNQQKAAKVVQPNPPKANPPVVAKKAQPEAKPTPTPTPNGNATKVKPNSQPQPKANPNPNGGPKPATPNPNGGPQPQPETSAKKEESSCLIA